MAGVASLKKGRYASRALNVVQAGILAAQKNFKGRKKY